MHDQSGSEPISFGGASPAPYAPPWALIARVLRISAIDLKSATVTVPGEALRQLIAAIIEQQDFDAAWYEREYPDVHGAILAGSIKSAKQHFVNQGYFEGRLPCEMRFNHIFYFDNNPDLGAQYSRDDAEGLRRHYVSTGYFEGRAGTEDQLDVVNAWGALASTSHY